MKKSRIVGALCSAAFTLVTSLLHAAILPMESRLGGLAYYDPNLNITWVQDANINSFMDWTTANNWAAGLNIDGVTGWRLPSADVNGDSTVVDCFGGGVSGCADNEMGFLYWEEGITAAMPDVFSNVQFSNYSFSTEFAPDTTKAWIIDFGSSPQTAGTQQGFGKTNQFFAWAVHNGDVSAVPVPAAAWLFGSGLLGLLGVARRKKKEGRQ